MSILLASSSVSQLGSAPGLILSRLSAPRMTLMLMNTARAPFDNLKVREVIRLAIDNAGISNAVFEGHAPPTAQPFRMGEPWAPANAPVIPPDYRRARALIAEAGVDLAGKTFTLDVHTSKSELRPVAEIIQAGLAEIGMKVDVSLAEYAAIEPRMIAGEFDMAML